MFNILLLMFLIVGYFEKEIEIFCLVSYRGCQNLLLITKELKINTRFFFVILKVKCFTCDIMMGKILKVLRF